jgi:sucrose-6-phosphate hydrolase SacC (GH32 family)
MIASLAALHKVLLFSSPDLKNWSYMSDFGPANAIGGNWECPGLFQLPVDGNTANKKWVLMLGRQPGRDRRWFRNPIFRRRLRRNQVHRR